MPPRRSRKRNTRMDAAIDAMMPLGFPEELVRSRVKDLLHEYGGDEGWAFIEDSAYLLLLESCLEANNGDEAEETGLLLNAPPQDCDAEEHATLDVAAEPISSEAANTFPQNSRRGEPFDTDTEEHAAQDAAAEPIRPEAANTFPQNSRRDFVILKGMDFELDQISGQNKTAYAITNDKTLDEGHPDKRRPCYGWIDCDEDEEDADDYLANVVHHPVMAYPPFEIIRPKRRPCYGWIDNDEDEEDADDFIYLRPAVKLTPAAKIQIVEGATKNNTSQRAT